MPRRSAELVVAFNSGDTPGAGPGGDGGGRPLAAGLRRRGGDPGVERPRAHDPGGERSGVRVVHADRGGGAEGARAEGRARRPDGLPARLGDRRRRLAGERLLRRALGEGRLAAARDGRFPAVPRVPRPRQGGARPGGVLRRDRPRRWTAPPRCRRWSRSSRGRREGKGYAGNRVIRPALYSGQRHARERRGSLLAPRQRRAAACHVAARRAPRARTPSTSSTGSRRRGRRWWQVLPLNPPDPFGSPYTSSSAFAGWRGLLAEPDARVSTAEIESFRRRHGLLGRRLGALRRSRSAGRPGPLRARVERAAAVRGRARDPA